jgi:hypothetical protein
LARARIAEKTGAARQTVNGAKNAFVAAETISVFLQRKKRGTPPVAPKIAGEAEARAIALACAGRAREADRPSAGRQARGIELYRFNLV